MRACVRACAYGYGCRHCDLTIHRSTRQDAVELGVNAVELDNQGQYYVGYGGFPNAAGEMELDAAVMEGTRRCVLGVVEGNRSVGRLGDP